MPNPVSISNPQFLITRLQGWSRLDFNSGPLLMAGVVESSKPRDGYDTVTVSGNTITSKDIFQGRTDSDTPAKQFRIKVSVSDPVPGWSSREFVLQEEFLQVE